MTRAGRAEDDAVVDDLESSDDVDDLDDLDDIDEESDEPHLPWLLRAPRGIAWILLVCGGIGLAASFSLTIEYFHKLQDPDAALLCDVNLFVTCGPAMQSWAGSLLGFPNVIIGLVSFSVVVAIAMGTLAGARFRPWFWVGLQIGLVLAAALITFLQWFSVVQLARLCIWCMIIWAATIPLVTLTTIFTLAHGHLGRGGVRVGRALAPYAWTIVAIWVLAVIGFIIAGMWSSIQVALI